MSAMRIPCAPAARRGITVVEVLVTIGVTSLLLSILSPAVQRARESARAVSCRGNLRQMGLATESFVGLRARYPKYLHIGSSVTLSGHVDLLPFLSQQPLHDSITRDETGFSAIEPVVSSANEPARRTSVSVLKCPSDPMADGGANSYRACFGSTTGIHATWEPGKGKPLPNPDLESLWGIFCGRHEPRHITDGLSNTVAFSERLVGDNDPSVYTPAVDIVILDDADFLRPNDTETGCRSIRSVVKHFSSAGVTWLLGHRPHTAYNHVLPPNSPVPDCVDGLLRNDFGEGAITARSYHPGGVHACFADSSVRMISDQIDLKVWRALGTIHGNESVDSF